MSENNQSPPSSRCNAHSPRTDCWFGVQDPKLRKKIQDRLAQRARRRRLAKQKQCPGSAQSEKQNRHYHQPDCLFDWDWSDEPILGRNNLSDSSSQCLSNSTGALIPVSSNANCSSTSTIPLDPSPSSIAAPFQDQLDHSYLPTSNAHVYSALFINGTLLGLTCGAQKPPTVSAPPGPDIPPSLRPTHLQLTTEHLSFIDRFPFPRMRDNFIMFKDLIDPEEFLSDLFCLMSFTLEPGAYSWDPSAWKISPEFAQKWGFLFC